MALLDEELARSACLVRGDEQWEASVGVHRRLRVVAGAGEIAHLPVPFPTSIRRGHMYGDAFTHFLPAEYATRLLPLQGSAPEA
jgi:hypothetical protein